MLEKAVVALKDDKAKALGMFNKGEGGFEAPRPLRLLRERLGRRPDRASLPEGRAPPGHRREEGFPLGKAIMKTAAEGKIQSVTYWWPRPGTETPLEKHTFYTKVGDQICGVGYYKR